MQAVALAQLPWRDPVAVASAFAHEPCALALLTGGSAGWSYLAIRPDAVLVAGPAHPDPFSALAALVGEPSPGHPDGPPFQGGIAGLAAYGLGARAEGIDLPRGGDWPDLICARYSAVLAFDHKTARVIAVGRGEDQGRAQARAAEAGAWLDRPAPTRPAPAVLAASFISTDAAAYETAVADVIARIEDGELFQANIARRWLGRLESGAEPFDLFARLAGSSAATFSAYMRLPDDGEGGARALVSNSPERFLAVAAGGRLVRTEPIKGTRPRGDDAAADAALSAQLLASPKDRAENLMIVDLMRNDLSRVCEPGGVRADDLFRLLTVANVHHLASTVTGRLREGLGVADLMRATLPPGSITGAPKVQAMRLIAAKEPPRGPFFGTLFWAGFDGAMDSSVLIRTAAFQRDAEGWTVEARAGAGIVADSDPHEERLETEAKIDALRRALTEPAP